jgi:toxin CcdB
MARLDVDAHPGTVERKPTPYFVEVQNDFSSDLSSRVVVPLRRDAMVRPRTRDLNPVLQRGDTALVWDTAALGAVPRSELGKPLASVRAERHRVHDALDALSGSH